VSVGTLILVQSLPYPQPYLVASELLNANKISTNRAIHLFGTCSAVIDALAIGAQIKSSSSEDVLIVVADCFGELIDPTSIMQKPDTREWKNGGSAIL